MIRQKLTFLFLLIFSLMFFLVPCPLTPVPCPLTHAAVPHLINYQGKLTDKDSKPVSDGVYAITFSIYDSESAGSLLWTETQQVSLQKGVFSVLLGGVTNLNIPFDKDYWLELKVKDEVMSPRQRIASVGYAVRAETVENAQNADKVDGCDAGTSADNVLKLTDTGKIPSSAFKLYDSGWFYISTGQGVTLTHNLGTTKMITRLYFSTNSSGSDMMEVGEREGLDGDKRAGQIIDITSTTFRAQAAHQAVTYSLKNDGGEVSPQSGYYRVVAIALE
jgi:hypothetical protein